MKNPLADVQLPEAPVVLNLLRPRPRAAPGPFLHVPAQLGPRPRPRPPALRRPTPLIGSANAVGHTRQSLLRKSHSQNHRRAHDPVNICGADALLASGT